jgi:hypothetical protein
MTSSLPNEIECYRDRMWCRDPELRIEGVLEAEQLIDKLGFCFALTDSRQPGPSLYIAVCGRRDAILPRNVQKDPECSLAWNIKDEVMRRGRVYYGKLSKGKATFIARRLVPYFNAIWGIRHRQEKERLSLEARAILKVLRREWEMATGDLRRASGIPNRTMFTRAMDELQKNMLVIPEDVLYQPMFTYIWTLSKVRFSQELSVKMDREVALKEIARSFLNGAGITLRGELAKTLGLSRPDAGLGNRALVREGYAISVSTGIYKLTGLETNEDA